jgi:hypothetical protein
MDTDHRILYTWKPKLKLVCTKEKEEGGRRKED